MSVLEELKRLDTEREKIITKAKSEALKKADDAIQELNALGFNYRIVEGGSSRTSGSSERTGTRTPKDAPCPICGFKTEPPHDKRSHRTHPQPFSEAELAAKHMVKVS